jgi:hypothetical protein
VRPDGAVPRSLAHEVLLTAWDGSKLAQRIERGVLAMRDGALPTLTQIVERGRR